MERIPVSVDNFVRAESDRMLADIMASAGGINRWRHDRAPADVDDQVVVRMNRDTLYSTAVVDLAEGATLTVPDAGERYLSVMVVSQDHYITDVLHDAGQYELDMNVVGSRYALIAARVLVDPEDAADLDAAARLQDAFGLQAPSAEPFVMPPYEKNSFDGVRSALKDLARYSTNSEGTFGAPDEVDPVHHLVGAAAGWGGLPAREAIYLIVEPRLPVGEYRLTVGDVPVDGFWSVSVYNADGFFEPNERAAYSINSVTADRDPDGTATIHFGGCGDDRPNCVPIMEGWNYTVRLYRPRPEILEGTWRFPTVEAID